MKPTRLQCDLDTSIPDWMIDHPESAVVFDELRLDSSCAGKSLAYVCQQQGLHAEDVLRRLVVRINAAAIRDRDGNAQPPPDSTVRPSDLGKGER